MSRELHIKQNTHLYIGLPSHDGQLNNWTHAGLMRLQKVVQAYSTLGLKLTEDLFNGSSLIEVSRNQIARNFLLSDATHLLFVDSDVGFFGDDALKLVGHDKDVVGGVYPRKKINWSNIRFALKQNPELKDEELEMLAVDYAFKTYDVTSDYDKLMKLEYPSALPTGFLCIKRHVLEGLFDKVRAISHTSGELREFFHVDIDGTGEVERNGKIETIPGHCSEDFFFNYLAMKHGYEVWLDPTIPLCHVGPYTFKGSLQKIAKLVKEEIAQQEKK